MEMLQKAVVWRNLQANGSDYCELWRTAEGWVLKGTAIAVLGEAGPVLCTYDIQCDNHWQTQRAEVTRRIGSDVRKISLLVESRGSWQESGQQLPGLHECVDVDLSITPATNTLPIRRLKLLVGASHEATAAWVRLPELEVQPLSQRYTRIDSDTYRYESATGYSTILRVDEKGLVKLYFGAWEVVGSATS
ncbi:MAG: putative glycolipid-binding domain-containing protein [Bryobacteraceae bacterium]